MSKKEFETEFYRFVKGAKDTRMMGGMMQALEKRMRVVRDERMERKDQEHDMAIKKLKPGTIVLARFGELANQEVEVVRHGSKRTTIRTEGGEEWYYPRRSLVYQPNKSDRLTAKTNQQLAPMLSDVVAKVGLAMKEVSQ